MSIAAVTVVAGVLLALLAGGRPSYAADRPIRALNAVWAGVALQIGPQLVDVGGRLGLALVLAGYGLLVAFAVVNLRLVGMPIALVGLALNLTVIALNAGMPVRAEALVAADQASWAELPTVDLGAKRHIERADDRLAFLGDTLPIEPLHEVVSFGDLILAAGVGDVAFRLLRPAGLRRQRRTQRRAQRTFAPRPLEV